MSQQSRQRAPNSEEVRLFLGAQLFHPHKLTTCPSYCEIKWSKTAHAARDLTKATVLPTIVRVDCGYFGQGNIESVSSGQHAIIQGVYKQRRVVAIPCRTPTYSHYWSFPVIGYPYKFSVSTSEAQRSAGKAGNCSSTTIDCILKQVQLPAKVRFADDQLHAEFNYLRLVHVYEEMYLYGHNMAGDGSIFMEVMFMPIYLDVTLNIGEGLVDGNQNDWIILKDAYINQSAELLQGSLTLGYTDIAIFDGQWNGIQDVTSAGTPKSSVGNSNQHKGKSQGNVSDDTDDSDDDVDDDYHTYVSPSNYIKIDGSLHSRVTSASAEYIQIEGRLGNIGRRMETILEMLEQDQSPTSAVAPPPRPPKAVLPKPLPSSHDDCTDAGLSQNAPVYPLSPRRPQGSLTLPKTCPRHVGHDKEHEQIHPTGQRSLIELHKLSPVKESKPPYPAPSRPLPATPEIRDHHDESGYEVPGNIYQPKTVAAPLLITPPKESAAKSTKGGLYTNPYTPTPHRPTVPAKPKSVPAACGHLQSQKEGGPDANELVPHLQQTEHAGASRQQREGIKLDDSVTSYEPPASMREDSCRGGKIQAPLEPPSQYAPKQATLPCDMSGLHQPDSPAIFLQQVSPSALVLASKNRPVDEEGVDDVSTASPCDHIRSNVAQYVNLPERDHGKISGSTVKVPADIPLDFSSLSHKDLCQCFRLSSLNSVAAAFEEDGMIDGCLLLAMNVDALCEHFKFSQYDAIKVMKFAKEGWRPR